MPHAIISMVKLTSRTLTVSLYITVPSATYNLHFHVGI